MTYTDEMVLLAADGRWHDLWNAAGFDKKDAYARLRIAVKGTKWASCSRKKLRNVAKGLRARKQQGERTAVKNAATAKARKAAMAKAAAGDRADYEAILAAEKKHRDATRVANGDLPSAVKRKAAMAKAAAGDPADYEAILAADTAYRRKLLARWKKKAKEGCQESADKLQAYNDRYAAWKGSGVNCSDARWEEVLATVDSLLALVGTPEGRVAESEALVARLLSRARAARFDGAATFYFAAGLARVIGNDGWASPDEALKAVVGLPSESAADATGHKSAFARLVGGMNDQLCAVDKGSALVVDD
jgi:hypothetical protein